MTTTDDLAEARRQHKPSLALFRAQVEQRRQEIEQEMSLDHEINNHLQSITGALDGLAKIMSTPFGAAMIERECLNLGDTKSLLVRLAIMAWKKTEQRP